jgi:hypothetical protein
MRIWYDVKKLDQITIGGGVEVMTRTPMGSSVVRDLGFPSVPG